MWVSKIWRLIDLKHNRLIGQLVSVFANGLGSQGSIPGRVIPKTFKKWYLIPLCLTLSITRYVSRVKWRNAGKGVAPSPTLLKREPLGHPRLWSPTLLTYIYIYTNMRLLYIDLRPGQTCHSKVMHRKEVTHSDGSYEKKSRRQA